MDTKVFNRKRIQLRIRKKIKGTSAVPRLSVAKSNRSITCQLIDDINSITLASASGKEVGAAGNKSEMAKKVGALIAGKAKNAGIESVKFDRGGYIFHGRIKALADGAREGGLKF